MKSQYGIPLETKIQIVFSNDIKDRASTITGIVKGVKERWLVIETPYNDMLYINQDKIRYIRESDRDS